MKMIQSKMKETEWSQHFSHLCIWGFYRRVMAADPGVLSPIWPNFLLLRDIMVVLVICKNEEDPIKNTGARVFTALYIIFSDAQG